MNQIPVPPKPPQSPAKSSGGLSSWLAVVMLFSIVVLGVGLLWIGQVGKFAPFLLLIGALFFAVVVFHYVVWGWWLPRILERERRREAESDEGGS